MPREILIWSRDISIFKNETVTDQNGIPKVPREAFIFPRGNSTGENGIAIGLFEGPTGKNESPTDQRDHLRTPTFFAKDDTDFTDEPAEDICVICVICGEGIIGLP